MQGSLSDRPRGWLYRGKRLAFRLSDAFFFAPRDWFGRLVNGASLAALLLFGVYLWGIFYSWGNISLDFLDWAEVTGPRYALLKDAVSKGQLPLHAANTTALRGLTDRYFSIPDTPFSPQVFLLRYLEIGRYLFLDTLLFYLLGFAGLVLIARKYRLAPAAFFVFFLVFCFNGNVSGHLAVGHSIWTGYFLLPFFVYLTLELVERKRVGWSWLLGFSLYSLAVLLQGGFHQYLWCLMFLGILALLDGRLWKPVVLGGLFAVLVGLPRLLPPALIVSNFSRTNQYLGGFGTLTDLFANLIILRDPDRAVVLPSKIFPLNWWEQDYFIGLLPFALLIIFGVLLPLYRWYTSREKPFRDSPQMQILSASLIFSTLSIGQVYEAFLRILPLPPFTGERVTSRLFILPLVFVFTLAVIHFQRELEQRRPGFGLQLLLLGLGAVAFHDVNQHLQAWRIRYLDGLVYLFKKVPFDAAQHTISNHADPLYITLLIVGSIAAVLALGVLVVLSLRERSRQSSTG